MMIINLVISDLASTLESYQLWLGIYCGMLKTTTTQEHKPSESSEK